MREQLGRFKFKVGLLSFLQVNPVQTVKLYNVIKKCAELSGEEIVVDAYAGIGTIAFWLSEKAAEVIGIEEREEAIKDANQNIALNKLANVKMIHGLAEKDFPKRADVAVLDPPRGGCSEHALKRIVRAEPRRIIYVSCNPATLARDLRMLIKEDYRIEIVQPVDMFPQTEHVEVVVKLSRGAGRLAQ
jgi:23S rRNA (uracil-5-)-methyltransferase RumA